MALINLKSDLTWKGDRNKAPNRVPNDGTLYQNTRFVQDANTQDISSTVKGYAQYARYYPSTLKPLTSKGSFSLSNSKYNFGNATRITQGGIGYPFPDYNGIIYDWKPGAHTGFNSKATYGALSGDGKGDTGTRTGFLQATYTTNSPIDDMYKKYNLQDASFQGGNWWSQPYVLRGIQLKGNKPKPQRWGFGANFDDGLIRGGIVTATERTLFDVARIGKWMTSPKGLLWVVKQVGLGLTNAPVEKITGKVALTQIQPGLTSLASVAGNAFGLHFTRHAIPFLNDVGSYENVLRAKRISDEALGKGPTSNRLIKLREELLVNTASRIAIRPGLPIPSLSTGIFGNAGIGGAQSILGLIGTTIKRYVDTREGTDAVIRGIRTFNTAASKYNVKRQYAQGLNTTAYLQERGTSTTDSDKRNTTDVDDTDFFNSKSLKKDLESRVEFDKLGPSFQNPVQRSGTGGDFNNDYVTIAYGRIPKDDVGDVRKFRNFIDLIDTKDREALLSAEGIGTYKTQADYNEKNIVKQFGYKHYTIKGVPGQNVTDMDNGSTRDGGTATGYANDIVKFQIGTTKFRAYIDSISDSFTPSIDTEQPLGSPIQAVRFTTLERSVSVSFKMAVLVKEDLKRVYLKMKKLQEYATYSTEAKNAFTVQTIPIIIGDLYNFTGYIESISFDWDSEMPWEIQDGNQVPLYCNVSVDFKYLKPTAGFKLNN